MRLLVIRTLKSLVVLSALAFTNCSSSSSNNGAGSDADKFVGVWQYTSGTATPVCTGFSASISTLTGNVTVTKSTTSDLLVVEGTCNYHFTVSGTTANANAAQSCTTTGTTASGVTYSEVDTVSSLVFTTTDGKIAHVSGTYNGVITALGATYTCVITITGDLQKQ